MYLIIQCSRSQVERANYACNVTCPVKSSVAKAENIMDVVYLNADDLCLYPPLKNCQLHAFAFSFGVCIFAWADDAHKIPFFILS